MRKSPQIVINNDSILKLRPCQSRLDNYLKHYKGKAHSKVQFMGLKSITHSDKLWVAFRSMKQDQLKLAVADIAESVLSVYESNYPNDRRPREAIEAARLYVKGKITLGQLEEKQVAARAAAYSAYSAADDAARAAAYSAYSAADDAAYSAYSAARAAAYSAYSAARAAAYSAYSAYSAAYSAQEKLIRKIILKYWK